MKKDDLQLFDKDDWLSKERARESRVSVWDFDDARKLRQEHSDNCDAETGANNHRIEHLRNNYRSAESLRRIDGNYMRNDIMWFIIDVFAMVFLIILNSFMEFGAGFIAVAVLFLGINPGIFIWLFFFRRFPSAGYSKMLLFIAVVLQLVGMFIDLTTYY